MNNKGFMMAEVVVVASIVMITLAGLYQSYVKIYAIYNERIKYYDAEVLYQLAFYRDSMYVNGLLDSVGSDIQKISNDVIDINENDTVYLLPCTKLSSLKSEDINLTFKDYVDYLTGNLEIETDNMMVMERCDNNIGENCRYAYLEVYLSEAS